MMKSSQIAEYEGQPITAYTIENKSGVQMTVLDYGATWYQLTIPTAEGRQNLLMSFKDVADYTEPSGYPGKIIGRVAGRIGDSQFKLGDRLVTVPANEGTTCLHGGPNGLSTRMWQASATDDTVTLTCDVTEAIDGFPGNLTATVTYQLTDSNQVIIKMTGASDALTVFNPTNHVYWNLNAGDETVLNHQLTIASDSHLELPANKVPTGAVIDNAGTPFDFTTATSLGKAIDGMQVTDEKGFDDVFLIGEHDEAQPVATLSAGAITVEEYSNRNALVVFTTNKFDQSQAFEKTSQPYVGIAMEAQTAPNAISDSAFGDITLAAGTPRTEEIRYAITF